jgi:putative acetyltransferase
MAVETRIRRAGPEDAARIRSIHLASIRGLAAGSYPAATIRSWSAPRPLENYRRAMRQGEVFWLAFRGPYAAGFASLAKAELRAVYVRPHFARLGVGTALLAGLEIHARKRREKKLALVSSLNAAAFYEQQGFKVRKRVKIRLRDGCLLAALAMEKRLGPRQWVRKSV